MSNTDLIIELLEKIHPGKYCDDCLSKELEVFPRQQVNQICRNLEIHNKLVRKIGLCLSCGKNKIVNLIQINQPSPTKKTNIQSMDYSESVIPSLSKIEVVEDEIDIQKIRREVVQICLQIWGKKKKEPLPNSISITINQLKSENYIPYHQSNMMLTICGLRNCYEYGDLILGKREKIIANNAWEIVLEWWNKNKQEYLS